MDVEAIVKDLQTKVSCGLCETWPPHYVAFARL